MSEYRWITTNKQGSCQSCKELIEQGERVLWQCKTPNVWCHNCGTASGITDTQAEQPKQWTSTQGIKNNVETDAMRGHRENMESAKQLRITLDQLCGAVKDLTAMLRERVGP